MNLKKYLPIGLFLGFLIFGVSAFLESKPTAKNERIYNGVKEYSPYYLDKRFGGLLILNKEDKEFKEKPSNMELFKEFERLEKEWGKKHLKLINNQLIILDNNQKSLKSIDINSKDELNFIHSYYGL